MLFFPTEGGEPQLTVAGVVGESLGLGLDLLGDFWSSPDDCVFGP